MNIFRKPKVTTLSEWLEVATRKLENTAKERIRKEIEAHYAEAVQTHREEGSTEIAAQAAALEELGDARTAGRRFRREHLTQGEVKKLYSLEKQGRSFALLFINYLFFVSTFIDFSRAMKDHYFSWLLLALEVSVLLVFPTVCFLAPKSDSVKKHLLIIQPSSGFASGLCIDHLFARDAVFVKRFDIVLGLLILAYFFYNMRLWYKLRRIGTVCPPANTLQI